MKNVLSICASYLMSFGFKPTFIILLCNTGAGLYRLYFSFASWLDVRFWQQECGRDNAWLEEKEAPSSSSQGSVSQHSKSRSPSGAAEQRQAALGSSGCSSHATGSRPPCLPYRSESSLTGLHSLSSCVFSLFAFPCLWSSSCTLQLLPLHPFVVLVLSS